MSRCRDACMCVGACMCTRACWLLLLATMSSYPWLTAANATTCLYMSFHLIFLYCQKCWFSLSPLCFIYYSLLLTTFGARAVFLNLLLSALQNEFVVHQLSAPYLHPCPPSVSSLLHASMFTICMLHTCFCPPPAPPPRPWEALSAVFMSLLLPSVLFLSCFIDDLILFFQVSYSLVTVTCCSLIILRAASSCS